MRAYFILATAAVLMSACEAGPGPAAPDPSAELSLGAPLALEAAADPCTPLRLGWSRDGLLEPGDCVFDGLGFPVLTDLYTTSGSGRFGRSTYARRAVIFETDAAFGGAVGVTPPSSDFGAAKLLSGVPLFPGQSARFGLVGLDDEYQYFILGGPFQTGDYSVETSRRLPGFHDCDIPIGLVPPVSLFSILTPSNACAEDVDLGATPSHSRFVQVDPGETFTVRFDAFSWRFRPEVYVIGFDGEILASDAEPLSRWRRFREVTVDVPARYDTPQTRFARIVILAERPGTYRLSIR